MKIRIHRGTHEVGGSCVELEADGQRILLDAGLPLDQTQGETPDLPRLNQSSLSGIIISHPHLDHYGLLPWLPKVPVYMGAAARRIICTAAMFTGQQSQPDGPNLEHGKPLKIGPFSVTPYLVDHSAYDAYALLVEGDGKRVFYSGDIRLHGRKGTVVDRFISSPPPSIDLLLLEGTTLSRTDTEPTPSEAELEQDFVGLFGQVGGLVLVHTSAQNIDRVVTIHRACLKSGKTLVLDLYAALILAATENPRIPQSHWDRVALCIPQRQRIQIKNQQWFEELAQHSRHRIYPEDLAKEPGKYVLLFRPLWMEDLVRDKCLKDACCIHSMWEGYLDQPSFQQVNNWRERHSMALHQIHTSGHAGPSDLKRLAHALSPKKLIPIHTTAPDEFSDLYPPVQLCQDGEWHKV